jgi:hypothetical protein
MYHLDNSRDVDRLNAFNVRMVLFIFFLSWYVPIPQSRFQSAEQYRQASGTRTQDHAPGLILVAIAVIVVSTT